MITGSEAAMLRHEPLFVAMVICENYRVFCSAIVIMSLFTVIPQGPFVSQTAENICPYRRVVGF